MADAIAVFSPGDRITDDAGLPVSGAKLKFYDSGTTTPKTVYSDAALSTSLGSTVYCDSAGYPVTAQGGTTKTAVYTGTAAYKLVITDSDDTTIATHDAVRGQTDTSGFPTSGLDTSIATTAKSSNYTVLSADGYGLIVANPASGSFTLTLPSAITVGDGWWIDVVLKAPTSVNSVTLATVSSQTIASELTAATSYVLSGSGTYVRVISDGANWLVLRSHMIGGNSHPSTTVASATTCDIGAANADVVEITGTTTITGFGTAPNRVRMVRFAAALTLTHNATSLILPAGANITTAAGDVGIFVSDSSGYWRCWSWIPFKAAASQSDQETGTSTTVAVVPAVQQYHPSSAKAWVTFNGTAPPTILASYNVTSVTRHSTGDYTVAFTNPFSSANYVMCGSCRHTGAGQFGIVSLGSGVSKTSSSCRIGAVDVTTPSVIDSTEVNVAFFGDQ